MSEPTLPIDPTLPVKPELPVQPPLDTDFPPMTDPSGKRVAPPVAGAPVTAPVVLDAQS